MVLLPALVLAACTDGAQEPDEQRPQGEGLVVTWLAPPQIRSVGLLERPVELAAEDVEDETAVTDLEWDADRNLWVGTREVVVVAIDPVPGASGYRTHVDGEGVGAHFTGQDVTTLELDREGLPEGGTLSLTAFASAERVLEEDTYGIVSEESAPVPLP